MHLTPRGLAALGLAATALVLAACGGHDDDTGTSTGPVATPLACGQLVGVAIPAASIGLPTTGGTVATAVSVAASGTGPSATVEHCLVNASLSPVDTAAPKILFRLALPATWNGKAVMFGGGGFDGSIPNVVGQIAQGPADVLTPLARGYATFASDSGHQATALGSQDGSAFVNDEAVRNFGGDALKKTRDAAVFLIGARYAQGAPTRSYFAGGSTGGREALAAIQRWPADWNGAIAWYPAWNDAAALLFGQKVNRTLAQPGAYPNQAKKTLLFNASVAACDTLDGVADGLVSNQVRCNATFDPATAVYNGTPLRCPGGADTGNTCFSDVQIAALRVLDAGARFNYSLASGETGYPGFNVWGSDLGRSSASPVQAVVNFLALGTVAPADPMPLAGAPYVGLLLDQWVKYAVTRDPTFHSLTLDPENAGPYTNRISELSTQLDTKTDISGFVGRGGKLLLAHGLSDVLVSTRATEIYYQRLQAQFGPTAVDGFARYYEVPGFGHAVSSVFNATWDSLTALENWAERGNAPSAQVTTDSVGVPGRTRPLCDYPKWPQYRGTGDVNLAASFACVS